MTNTWIIDEYEASVARWHQWCYLMLLYSNRNLLQCHFDHHKSHMDYCVIVPRALRCESVDQSPELCYMTVWIYVTIVQRGSWESTVRAVTCHGLDSVNPGGSKMFHALQSSSEAHPTSCTMSTGSLPGVKQLGRGVDHIPPFCAKDVYGQNEVSALPPLPSNSVPSWHVVRSPLPFNCTKDNGNDNTTVKYTVTTKMHIWTLEFEFKMPVYKECFWKLLHSMMDCTYYARLYF